MVAGWHTVPLGEVLRPALDPHKVDASRSYPNLGIYSFGRGVFAKQPIEGTTTSASTLYRVRAGQFIYSRLFAFEGAYALVPPELCGSYVSNEFPTFDCDPRRLDVGFLTWLFKRPKMWRTIAERSTGMGDRRQRIHPEQVLAEAIPLPPLNEQRRIVARIDALAAKIAEARGLREQGSDETEKLWPAALDLAFRGQLCAPSRGGDDAHTLLAKSACNASNPERSNFNNAYPYAPKVLPNGLTDLPVRWTWTTLGSVLTHMVDCVNDTPEFAEEDTGYIGLKTTNIRPYRLELSRRWYVTPSDFGTWNRRAEPEAGDLVLTREAPVGHVCQLPAGVRVCLTQRLMLLRPARAAVSAGYLLHFLNSPMFKEQISASGRGQTHPHIRVQDAPDFLVPLAPNMDQRLIVAELDALHAKVDAVKRLQAETAAELDALLPAILDRAFKGEL